MRESESSGGLGLSPLQRRLITTALAGLSVFVIAALVFGLFLLLQVLVTRFSNVLWPLATATILAFLLRPVVASVEERTPVNRLGGIILLYALVVLTLAVVLVFLVPILLQQTLTFLRDLPSTVTKIQAFIDQNFPPVYDFLENILGADRLKSLGQSWGDQLSGLLGQMGSAAGQVTRTVEKIITWATGLAIVPVYLFFLLYSRRRDDPLEEQLSWMKPDLREDLIFLVRQFGESMKAFFQGQILIALIEGVIFGVGFTIAGISFGFPLGFLLGLGNIIPYLGTLIGLATVLPIAWFQPEGGPVLVAIALGIFVAVQALEAYFLTPKIMGNRTGLHPFVIIIAIFFWGTALNGLLGMILAIPLTAFFVVAWRLLREKYLVRWFREDG